MRSNATETGLAQRQLAVWLPWLVLILVVARTARLACRDHAGFVLIQTSDAGRAASCGGETIFIRPAPDGTLVAILIFGHPSCAAVSPRPTVGANGRFRGGLLGVTVLSGGALRRFARRFAFFVLIIVAPVARSTT